MRSLIVSGLVLSAILFGAAASRAEQKPAETQGSINVPPEELKAYQPIEKATTPEAAMAAADAFLKKYPTSAAVPQVEIAVFNKIIASPKDEKRVGYNAAFRTMYPASKLNADLDYSMSAYWLEKGDFAQVIKVSEEFATAYPDDIRPHVQILGVGVEALKKQDQSLKNVAKTHGATAISMFEGTTRPGGFKDDAEYQAYKQTNLDVVYQQFGIIALIDGDDAAASANFAKAVAHNPSEPFTYLLIASIESGKYDALAKQYNSIIDKNTPAAQKKLEEVNAQTDREMLILAKAIAYSEGSTNQQYQAVNQQARAALTVKYKVRHGSLDGMDALIKGAKDTK